MANNNSTGILQPYNNHVEYLGAFIICHSLGIMQLILETYIKSGILQVECLAYMGFILENIKIVTYIVEHDIYDRQAKVNTFW